MSLSDTRAQYLAGQIDKQGFIDKMYAVHTTLFDYADFIQGTDIASIQIGDGRVIMTTRQTGIRLVCNGMDKRATPLEILNFGCYEQAYWDLLTQLIDEDAWILDIGANIGWYALNLARRYPQAHILAFEPIRDTYAYLIENLRLNCVTNVVPHCFGFSNCNDVVPFYFYPAGSGNASMSNLSGRQDVDLVACMVRKLDDFARESDLRVDFIKCDVEGAELLVLEGGRDVLATHQPAVFAEMLRKWARPFGYHPNQIIQLMASLDYRCFVADQQRLAEFRLMDEDTVETNFFFLHAHRHARSIEALTTHQENG